MKTSVEVSCEDSIIASQERQAMDEQEEIEMNKRRELLSSQIEQRRKESGGFLLNHPFALSFGKILNRGDNRLVLNIQN